MPQPREGVFASPPVALVGGGGGQHRTEVFLFLLSSDAAVSLLQSGEGARVGRGRGEQGDAAAEEGEQEEE